MGLLRDYLTSSPAGKLKLRNVHVNCISMQRVVSTPHAAIQFTPLPPRQLGGNYTRDVIVTELFSVRLGRNLRANTVAWRQVKESNLGNLSPRGQTIHPVSTCHMDKGRRKVPEGEGEHFRRPSRTTYGSPDGVAEPRTRVQPALWC